MIANNEMKIGPHEICLMMKNLPCSALQAWTLSTDGVPDYLNAQMNAHEGLQVEQAMVVAVARLNWLYQKTRRSLSGLFNTDDISALVDCYNGRMFHFAQLDRMAEDFCEYAGTSLTSFHGTKYTKLICVLVDLTPVQCLTLANVLELVSSQLKEAERREIRAAMLAVGIDLR